MNEREWFLELAPDEVDEGDEQGAVSHIIEEMSRAEERPRADDKQGRRVDLRPHKDALRRLLRKARHVHREVASDWKRRNSTEGSQWRPRRQLEKNFDPEERARETSYDYGDDAGSGFNQSWDDWWHEIWGKGRGNPGHFREHPEIPKRPLVAVYYLVNRWWRLVLRQPFWPTFSEGGLEAATKDHERLVHLGPAARFFFLVANKIDRRYTMDLCKKVHDDYYGKLPKRLE